MSRLSFTLAACAVLLSACDRSPATPAQGDDALAHGKESFEAARPGTGEIDRGQAGEPLPALTLTDASGRSLALQDTIGAPILVNLWATWCAPCIKEMPLLDELAADYGDRLQVVTISQDLNGADAVEPFFARNDLPNLPRWLDTETQFAAAIGAGGLPVTVLYDAQGMEVWRVAGDYDWSSLAARGAIDEAFEATAP